MFVPKIWPPSVASSLAMFALTMLACKHPVSFIICTLLRKCMVAGSIGAPVRVQQGGRSNVGADCPPSRLADCLVTVGIATAQSVLRLCNGRMG